MRTLLGEPTLWDEPSYGLGEQIEALIGNATRPATGSDRVHRAWWWGAAAILLTAVIGLSALATIRGSSPDWEVALPATPAAPNAAATVSGWNEEGGTRMLLTVDGLVPAPDGYTYEVWLSDGPIHVSAGTFRSGQRVELWAGVRRADFPRIWVTLEPLDADESPSPAAVLDTGYDADAA
jgi:hypothetical protein